MLRDFQTLSAACRAKSGNFGVGHTIDSLRQVRPVQRKLMFSLKWAYSFTRLPPGSLWLPSTLETMIQLTVESQSPHVCPPGNAAGTMGQLGIRGPFPAQTCESNRSTESNIINLFIRIFLSSLKRAYSFARLPPGSLWLPTTLEVPKLVTIRKIPCRNPSQRIEQSARPTLPSLPVSRLSAISCLSFSHLPAVSISQFAP
jgi:hypothetical protein